MVFIHFFNIYFYKNIHFFKTFFCFLAVNKSRDERETVSTYVILKFMPFFNDKFATNIAKYCTHMDKKLGVTIHPQKAEITAENKSYLQMFDALELLDKSPIDAENPYSVIASHIFSMFSFFVPFLF